MATQKTWSQMRAQMQIILVQNLQLLYLYFCWIIYRKFIICLNEKRQLYCTESLLYVCCGYFNNFRNDCQAQTKHSCLATSYFQLIQPLRYQLTNPPTWESYLEAKMKPIWTLCQVGYFLRAKIGGGGRGIYASNVILLVTYLGNVKKSEPALMRAREQSVIFSGNV